MRRKISYIWQYFSKTAPGIAKCIECNAEISYKGGATANLIRHTKNKHPGINPSTTQVYCEVGAEQQFSMDTETGNFESAPFKFTYEPESLPLHMNRKRGQFWKNYISLGYELAKCRLCNCQISYKGGSTGNLVRHLKRKHPIISWELKPQSNAQTIATIEITPPSTFQQSSDIQQQEFQQIEIIDEVKPFQKTTKRSNIWKYFFNNGTDLVKCLTCHCHISCKGGSTTNLRRHIRRKHPSISWLPEKLKPSTSQTLTSETTEAKFKPSNSQTLTSETTEEKLGASTSQTLSSQTTEHSPFQNGNTTKMEIESKPFVFLHKPISLSTSKQIDKQLICMIVKNLHSFSIVENTEFKNMVNVLNPYYHMPSLEMITTNISELYVETYSIVKDAMRDIRYIAISTDGWLSINDEFYHVISAHFIDNKSEMQSFVLGCLSFSKGHSSQDIYGSILGLLDEWEITEDICCIVNDSNNNIADAVSLIPSKHLPCFAYIINSIVQQGLLEIANVHSKIKYLVHYFKNSSNANNILLNYQKQIDCPLLRFEQDVSTRWSSTYQMFDSVLKIKKPLMLAIAECTTDLVLTEADLEILEFCCKILKPFQDILVEMCTIKGVTISKVILFSNSIHTYIDKLKTLPTEESPPEVHAMYNVLSTECISWLSDVEDNIIYREATFLDPRFKNEGFSKPETNEIVKKSLICRISKIISKQVSIDHTYSSQEISDTTDNIWAEFDKQVININLEKTPTSLAREEIELYLREPLLGRKEDPLKWWADRKYYYPHLYDMMRSLLCIPPTSVPCERFLSSSAELMAEKRKQLRPDEINATLFLNQNL